ncbi:hypothetical protein ND748_18710 [Frankia sp. AiPs1]|uniref:hypothetical protein n=1 Tax=Frankia sp. AiPs1 TaxID=573493 RepID=UPI0020438226|nr:hypothetical protein [Frankia sp. AiPs1]MCM3923689.1 hypothetical protein [Frankia sp. AiPs1]
MVDEIAVDRELFVEPRPVRAQVVEVEDLRVAHLHPSLTCTSWIVTMYGSIPESN